MGLDTEALAAEIGTRVKAARNSLGWTLDQLSERAEISRRMVVNVEQGAANPSIGTLLRLSEALGMTVTDLVEQPASGHTTITRRSSGATLWHGEHGGEGVLVSSIRTPDAVELWTWRVEAGEMLTSEPHPQGTRELLHIEEGTLTVTLGDEQIELHAGDAVTMPGDVQHSYANASDQPTRFTMAVYEPATATRRELP